RGEAALGRGWGGGGRCGWGRSGSRRWSGAGCGAARDDLRELAEELVGHLLGGAFDQARADLRELAADGGGGGVGENGVGTGLVRLQAHVGAALREAGDAALALAGDLVAVGRIEIGERDLAGEAGLDRADPGRDLGGHLRVRELLDLLAAGDGLLQDLRIVERLPDGLARRRNPVFARQLHVVSLPFVSPNYR